ncbi:MULTISPECIES: nitrilase family protein [Chryseobacterium]|uniref:Amidohydrolase n=1 Tax=Chryseobacterium camelliae TaxID=1265445 RepID=A0ABU0TGR8_9FLAO|nr:MULTISPECIES: nitrilase family protein [Chryseobacterium]MDT3405941.1 putative amidohydrolase [Pseudacidovorax intermedius]MDQ1096255.1 putative amidohydrolase [Chryseobacterium camelliae]MDQ1100192.1 putative amidohydrolase [Chryseobacterium sp. SORGH_AS_1048]MDR6087537.1 putative amidohydrolase [Chryseobacterium sp. SORGH_AS_0909]MDR6131911.1 putative amidohydrolase [Chryseobacterium sp. SORGH_AS_1175]
MVNLKIATAQFENRSGDKAYNLSVIEKLSGEAAAQGSKVILFHECSVTGYTFARKLSRQQMLDIAEIIPEGESIRRLQEIAARHNITILAGLFEKDEKNNLFKAFVCVDKNGLSAKYRKLHPFINPYLHSGNEYCIFEIHGWKCGILICYDNNIIENVRATKLLGADIIFMPHVTMCTPSSRPGAGFVDPVLWKNRETDPTSLRLEFDGMKGRDWLMKWLPARAYDNGIYVVFSNPIGMDDDQLKNGCSMIIDPFGDIIAECRSFEDSFAAAVINPEKLFQAGGYRYLKARRPELYRDIIGMEHKSEQKVVWLEPE